MVLGFEFYVVLETSGRMPWGNGLDHRLCRLGLRVEVSVSFGLSRHRVRRFKWFSQGSQRDSWGHCLQCKSISEIKDTAWCQLPAGIQKTSNTCENGVSRLCISAYKGLGHSLAGGRLLAGA